MRISSRRVIVNCVGNRFAVSIWRSNKYVPIFNVELLHETEKTDVFSATVRLIADSDRCSNVLKGLEKQDMYFLRVNDISEQRVSYLLLTNAQVSIAKHSEKGRSEKNLRVL